MNLRDELNDLAEKADVYGDPDAAVRTARRRRRVKLAASPLALVLAALLAVGVVQYARHGGGGDTAQTGPGVDYVTTDNRLHTWDGRTFPLEDKDTRRTVLRTPAGWLVSASEWEKRYTYLIRSDGTRIDLNTSAEFERSQLSEDGRRVFFWEPDVLTVADLTPDGLANIRRTPTTDMATPVGWSGDKVVVGKPADAGDGARWGTWTPGEEFAPQWRVGQALRGRTSASAVLLIDNPESAPCLVRVDAETGEELGAYCDRTLTLSISDLSPDGAYGTANPDFPGDDAHRPLVFDTAAMFGPRQTAPVPACANGEVTLGPDKLVYVVDHTAEVLYTCKPDGTVLDKRDMGGDISVVPANGAPPATPDPSPSSPVPTTPGTTPPKANADYITMRDGVLHTADGRKITIKGYDKNSRVVRVPLGWVFSDGTGALSLIRGDETKVELAQGRFPANWVMSADGTRIAYETDDTLYAARLTADGLSEVHSRPLGDAWLDAWAGDLVVVTSQVPEQEMNWATWDPATDAAAEPVWHKGAPLLLGASAQYLVVGPDAGNCLVLTDVRTGAETARRCDIVLRSVYLSPDGRYITGIREGATNGDSLVIDVAAAFGPQQANPVPLCSTTYTGTWGANGHWIELDSEKSITECAPDGSVAGRTEFPAGTPVEVALVPRYGLV